MHTVNINTAQLIHWFNSIRNLPDGQRSRCLDSFWSGQLQSKAWLSNELNKVVNTPSNVYVFGGWTGILSNIIFTNSTFGVLKIRSIDIDPWCEGVADTVNKDFEMDGWRFKARTSCMADYKYEWDVHGFITPHIVINTSTEHVSQKLYDQWYSNVPPGSLVIAQGNNFFDCPEHIRCCNNIDEFIKVNNVENTLFSGSLVTDMYTRYMAMWFK